MKKLIVLCVLLFLFTLPLYADYDTFDMIGDKESGSEHLPYVSGEDVYDDVSWITRYVMKNSELREVLYEVNQITREDDSFVTDGESGFVRVLGVIKDSEFGTDSILFVKKGSLIEFSGSENVYNLTIETVKGYSLVNGRVILESVQSSESQSYNLYRLVDHNYTLQCRTENVMYKIKLGAPDFYVRVFVVADDANLEEPESSLISSVTSSVTHVTNDYVANLNVRTIDGRLCVDAEQIFTNIAVAAWDDNAVIYYDIEKPVIVIGKEGMSNSWQQSQIDKYSKYIENTTDKGDRYVRLMYEGLNTNLKVPIVNNRVYIAVEDFNRIPSGYKLLIQRDDYYLTVFGKVVSDRYVEVTTSRYGVTQGLLNGPFVTKAATRLYGNDRYGTSERISVQFEKEYKASNPNKRVENVVIANGDVFNDALAAVTFAYSKQAPLLLSKTDSIDSIVLRELNRLNPSTVYLIDGNSRFQYIVDTELSKFNVVHIPASNLAIELRKTIPFTKVVIASNDVYADALSAAPLAAKAWLPILYSGKDELIQSAIDVLNKYNIQEAIIVGGKGAISDAVVTQLKDLGVKSVTRIGGADRYETSWLIFENMGEFTGVGVTEWKEKSIALATGKNFPDALAGASLAAISDSSILLADNSVHFNMDERMRLLKIELENVFIFGGPTIVQNLVYSVKE
ncbi:MAG: cell wall-binding repeat-containing protein [Endomicrobium sp.]|jgi:putative cell wall-binding protein|nr:cell wall-binding repeat-containing protein [Endomicrobium sp.]